MRSCLAASWILLLMACPLPEEDPPHKWQPGDGGDARHEEESRDPGERSAGDLLPGDAPPAFWACNPLYYNTRDGCDCGCGIPDPDCAGAGCDTPGCSTAACEYCHVGGDSTFTCDASPPPTEWSCSGYYYGDGYCDCGCTVADPDCAGAGCGAPDCQAAACIFCWGPTRDGDC